MPNEGVAFASIVVGMLVVVGTIHPAKQHPVRGSVWQIERVTGRLTPPVFVVVVIGPPIPTFTVAIERGC
jgi:hypothetical protein